MSLHPDPRPKSRTQASVVEVQTQYFQSADSGGSADLDLVSLGLADQSTGNGRANGDLAVFRLRLVVTHNLIYDLFAGIAIGQRHRGAKYNFIAGKLGDLDDLGPRQPVLDLPYLDIEKPLPLLRCVKLGVLGKIAMPSGLFNLLNKLWPLHAF